MTLEFGDLPEGAKQPSRGAQGVGRGQSLQDAANELQGRPQAWAKITSRSDDKKAAQTARMIATGKLAPFREGKWEAATSGQDVWARYVGSE